MLKGHLVGGKEDSKPNKEKPTPGQRRRENMVEDLNGGKGAPWNLKTSLVCFAILLSPQQNPHFPGEIYNTLLTGSLLN